MPIVFYHKDTCPPARAARLVAASLNIPLDLKYVDILGKKEQMEDWFLEVIVSSIQIWSSQV